MWGSDQVYQRWKSLICIYNISWKPQVIVWSWFFFLCFCVFGEGERSPAQTKAKSKRTTSTAAPGKWTTKTRINTWQSVYKEKKKKNLPQWHAEWGGPQHGQSRQLPQASREQESNTERQLYLMGKVHSRCKKFFSYSALLHKGIGVSTEHEQS